MEICGIKLSYANIPELDPGFAPMRKFMDAFEKSAEGKKRIAVAIERENGKHTVREFFIHADAEHRAADRLYVERLIKFLLWMRGGFSVKIYGDDEMADYIASVYSEKGERAFDFDFMANAYEKPFFAGRGEGALPLEDNTGIKLGGKLNGCRIGFDAGGSDRKVSAVVDGETVYSEEVVWNPKITPDISYHYNEIVAAMKTAAEHMPRVDAIGVSSAGVFVNNRCMRASLFMKVPPEDFEKYGKDIFIRAAGSFNVPLVVLNDGDVAALAGMMGLSDTNVLGIAMGTSEAVGYVDEEGNVKGWLNELAFAPVDINGKVPDPWSGDVGVGAMYFSQDSVIKLAPAAGITLNDADTPAQKLKAVQALMAEDDNRAAAIFRSIGVYLGHSLGLYYSFYGCRNVLLMGRVMSGKGGDIVLEYAKKTLREDYGYITDMNAALPDEKTRRVGQSAAAASLPVIEG